MLVKPSPLVAELNGSTAELTAASWKGRNYVRRKVVPANPNTAAQQAVRNSLTACVTLWRSLLASVKSWLDVYGGAYAMSGFNIFTSRNRALEQADSPLLPVPDNPNAQAVEDLDEDASPPLGFTIVWTDPTVTGFTKIFAALRRTDRDYFESQSVNTNASAETLTFLDLEAAKTYRAYVSLYNPTTGAFGTVASVQYQVSI
jgi:hypothetical protein